MSDGNALNRKSGQGLTVKGVTPILPSGQLSPSGGQVMRVKMPAKAGSPYMSNRSSQVLLIFFVTGSSTDGPPFLGRGGNVS